MITQMEVFTSGVTTPPFPIVDQDVGLDSIQIKNIDGLGPVTANVNTTEYGSIDGEILTGTSIPKRNIVITAALNPNWALGQTFESVRQVLYSYFMTENQVRLRFTSTHLAPLEIIGYVESCEPDMFSKDPIYQISIICPQPYFMAVSPTSIQGLTQAFATPVDVLVNYEGNADAGFTVDVTLPSGGTAFSGEARFINGTPTTKIGVVTPIVVSTTSFFRLSTVQGAKFARQYPIPTGLPTNVLGKWATGGSWITLRKGVNKIQILTATAGLSWTLSYYARYGGL
jgi:hypothetical protein